MIPQVGHNTGLTHGRVFVTLGNLPIALLERCMLLTKALQQLPRKRGHFLSSQALELVFGDLAHLRHVGS